MLDVIVLVAAPFSCLKEGEGWKINAFGITAMLVCVCPFQLLNQLGQWRTGGVWGVQTPPKIPKF